MRTVSDADRGMRTRCGYRWLVAALLAGGLPVGVAFAEEVVVKNDSLVDGGQAIIVGNFVPNERAGVVLTSPCNGNIVAVQVLWLSDPFQPLPIASLEEDITINQFVSGTFPTPGTELALLEAPLLSPGFLNEFRYLDENNTQPILVPITRDERFYVILRYANPTDITGNPPTASVVCDLDGCQSGRNVLFAIPGGWINFCFFLGGDLVIRAVVDCEGFPGACCLPNGQCIQTTSPQCAQQNGVWQGNNSMCALVQCPQPTGACCFQATSGCLTLTQTNCNLAGGVWAGAGTNCQTYACFPIGACCLPDGTCVENISPAGCANLGGAFAGNGTVCSQLFCPDPEGACCLPNGNCLSFIESDCAIVGGTWAGPLTTCPDACTVLPPTYCPGDMNCDTLVNFGDISRFIEAIKNGGPDGWTYDPGAGRCAYLNGDMNGDEMVNFADISGFIAAIKDNPPACVTQP